MNPLAGKQPQLVRVMGDWRRRDLRLVLRHLGVMTPRSRFGRGRRPSSQRADDPCRAIKIVALTGQLCATPQAHA
jgi:hypothetical protein